MTSVIIFTLMLTLVPLGLLLLYFGVQGLGVCGLLHVLRRLPGFGIFGHPSHRAPKHFTSLRSKNKNPLSHVSANTPDLYYIYYEDPPK